MPRLWGAKPEEREPPPVIEIVGTVDCGKRVIGELVAARIGATFISLPVLNPSRPVGKALLSGLLQNPQVLEERPEWWCHLYAAQLYEVKHEISRALSSGRPVIITNYLISFRLWAGAMGLSSLRGWTKGLPEPRIAYGLRGLPCPTNGNIPVNFSEDFLFKVNSRLRNPGDKRVIRLSVSESEQWHKALNSTAEQISTDLHLRYGVEVSSNILLSKDHFPKRLIP